MGRLLCIGHICTKSNKAVQTDRRMVGKSFDTYSEEEKKTGKMKRLWGEKAVDSDKLQL